MSAKAYLAITLLLILLGSNVICKNVVFLPLMITSHTRAHAFAAEELAKMGHKVWLAVPSALEKRNAEIYQGVNTFRYSDFWEESEDEMITNVEATVIQAVETGNDPEWAWVWDYEIYVSEIYFKALREGKLTNYITGLKPDLIVLDWNRNVDERVAIAYKLKVPFAILSAQRDYVSARIPFNALAEAYNIPHFRNHATFFEQVLTVIHTMKPLFEHIFSDKGYMKQLFPNVPDVPPSNEVFTQAEVFLVESDPILDYPRPELPNVKLVGGLSVGPAKPLQEPFKSFVERSKKAGVGIAVMSFGSLFMNLPKQIEVKLISVFRRLKLNTIWRANLTSPDPNKILTSAWIPQNDLLGNENVKVFITHSGAHSTYEGIYHGVPMVCLPIFYDQHYIADHSEDKGYCLSRNFIKISADDLLKVIEDVVSSDKIKKSIGTASEIYREVYTNSKQVAAFWLDHVMRYGGSYMRYSGQKIPMYLFIMDYLLIFLAGVLFTLVICLLFFFLKRTLRVCSRRNKHFKKE